MNKLILIIGMLVAAILLSQVFNPPLVWVVFFVAASIVNQSSLGGASKASRGRFRSKKASDANELNRFQHEHYERGSPHIKGSCGSCKHWTGVKKKHKSMRGVYVRKDAEGDCGYKWNGSQLSDLGVQDRRGCKKYESAI